MHNIYVNARFLSQPITGVQRFAIEISRQLKKIDNSISFLAPRNIIHHDLAHDLKAEICGRFSGHLWEQMELPYYLRKNGQPLLLCLANTAPLYYHNKVVTIHDVAFERFPQSFSWQFRLFYKFLIPRLLKSSPSLVTVSEFSRSEISEIYNYDINKIMVAHNAVNEKFNPVITNDHDEYILAVSSLNYQKNFHMLVKAFNCLKSQNVKLYIIGGFNKNFATTSFIHDIKKNKNIIFKGRVDDSELISLYSNALCFVFPSLYEGFGIPPLEAQACGCPVIVSDMASLPEVCGNSVLYCYPHNEEDIVEKISKLIKDKELQNDLKIKGFENVKRFSWEASAKKILDMMRQYNEDCTNS